jgi:hypothetical protein
VVAVDAELKQVERTQRLVKWPALGEEAGAVDAVVAGSRT